MSKFVWLFTLIGFLSGFVISQLLGQLSVFPASTMPWIYITLSLGMACLGGLTGRFFSWIVKKTEVN